VRSIQRALNAAGAQPPLEEDGLFGPKTEAAVRAFQGSGASGRVDRGTLQRLDPYLASGPAPQDGFGRGRATTNRRAPHVDQRPPDRGIPAGRLQQDAERRRMQQRRGGSGRPSGTPRPASPSTRRPGQPPSAVTPGRYDGRTPAPETTSQRAARPVSPPVTNSAAAGRSRETYDQAINQFGVGSNPRYARRNGNTYCNIFASDVTRAMGADIPHWVRRDGSPAEAGDRGAYEMNANATARWLANHGERHGWRRATAAEAQANANQGRPAVATRDNPGGIGHIVVVRPGEMTDRGPAIAQAGARNFNQGHIGDVFRRSQPDYWIHD